MLRVTIDGAPHEVREGASVLDALRSSGVDVPHLCHDDRLAPVGACRLCSVEVEGRPMPVASCTTPASEGMVIRSRTEALEADRRMILALLAARVPPEASDAERSTPFVRALDSHGIVTRAPSRERAVDASHPYIQVDLDRCIHCFRCERICSEVQGQNTWRIEGRGASTRLVPDSGTTLFESSCVSCGACVDSCPSGALLDRSIVANGRPTSWTRTTCPYCGVGCEMNVGVRDGRIVQILPVLESPVSRGHLCSKGRYAYEFVTASDRLTSPLIRDGDRFRPVSWDEALGFVASRLRSIVDRHGPDSVGVLGSARGTNEESYVAQKFARLVLGTNNVDCCARVCHAPSAAALKTMLGTGASTCSFDDIERARTIVVAGSNPTACHPVVGARIRQAVLRGANLVVVDPRRTELAEMAVVHLAPHPGSDLALFHAIARMILDEELEDRDFLRDRVDGLDEFRKAVAEISVDDVARACGVTAASIEETARLIATEKPALFFNGIGLTEHVNGTENVIGLVELALLTGNVGVEGAGVGPLRGQNNVQGSAHMGCEPHGLPGLVPIEQGRAAFEAAWGAPLPRTRGLDLMEMLDAAREGRFRALYAIGYDVELSSPDHARTNEALDALELVVVQDLFLTETAKTHAHVVLPAASAFEKDGTFMNAERRIERIRKAIDAPGEARSDARIVCDLARAMGHARGFALDSADAIWEEIRTVWPAGAGITYARLERGGLQWPCPDEAHSGTARLHATEFAHGRRTRLRGTAPVSSPENPSEAFPFLLSTGRHLQAFNAGTMTSRTAHVRLRPTDLLEISPDDAERLGLVDGDRVAVESPRGRAELPIAIRDSVRPGELFTTFHSPDVFINRVTGDGRDPRTHTPELKRTAVRLVPLRD